LSDVWALISAGADTELILVFLRDRGFDKIDSNLALRQLAAENTDAARDFARARLAKGLSNDTVNGSLRMLRRMLNSAREDEKIQFVPKIRLLKHSVARKGSLAKEQFDPLIALLPKNLKPLVTVLYYCGVRLGEAMRIDWSQVDLGAALVRLEEDQTKNSEARTIPLPDVLVEMLRRIEPKEGTVFQYNKPSESLAQSVRRGGTGNPDRG
jgi:integrase